jgi:hypothetical protein
MNSLQDLISTYGYMQWYASVIPARLGSTNKTIVQVSLGIKQYLISKITNTKRAGRWV